MELKGKSLRISIHKNPVNFEWINVEFKAKFNIWVGLCHRLYTAIPSQGWKYLLRQYFYLKVF